MNRMRVYVTLRSGVQQRFLCSLEAAEHMMTLFHDHHEECRLLKGKQEPHGRTLIRMEEVAAICVMPEKALEETWAPGKPDKPRPE